MAAAAGEIVELVHYTPSRIGVLTNRPSNAQRMITGRTGKPSGFWYSYRGEWKTELSRTTYADTVFEYILRVPAYTFTEDIFVADPASILRLTAENIVGFVQKYHQDKFIEEPCPLHIYPCKAGYNWFNLWETVKAEWGGVEFTASLRHGPTKIPIRHGRYGDITIDISQMIETLDIFPSGVLFRPAEFLKGANFAPTKYNAVNFFKDVGPSVRSTKKLSPPRSRTTAKKPSPPRSTKKPSPQRGTVKKPSPPRAGGGGAASLVASLLRPKKT